MLASVAMRSWSSTCWLAVRLVLHFFSLVNSSETANMSLFTSLLSSSLLFFLPPGAKCEANTFDGERCMYGCLNDTVRRILKDYKCVSVHAMQREGFDYCLHM